jgi:Zn-dependent protease
MLFSVFSQFQDNPPALIAYLAAFGVAMVTGLAFHEFCHAWSAYQLGDNTAARAGRLTLNPLKHLDPMGTLLMLVVGFGFAKPTPVNTHRLRFGSVRGGAIVSVAGPLSNFFIAALAALPLKSGLISTVASLDDISNASGQEVIGLFLVFIVFFNVLLGIFNLIPIPPLDGFDVLQVVLPAGVRRQLAGVRQWGVGILMSLFMLSFLTNGAINPIGSVVSTVSNVIFPLIT